MADLGVVANEVFEDLQSYNYEVQMYDENSMAVGAENGDIDVGKARRFICSPKNLMVTILDDDDNSRITLHIGKTVHINDVMGLDQKLRTLATKYNLVYRVQQSNKHITPKNFAGLATITEERAMQVCEGMYGTSQSSYLRLENARMIVRHNRRIDDSRIGARGRCVESVFVENAVGERSLMPTTNLMAGRAMTQHVNQGGAVADPVGQQINGMAMQYSNLGVGAGATMESAGALREACQCKRGKLRKTFERLSKPSSYAAEAEAVKEQVNMLTETPLDEARMLEVKQLLNGDVSDEVVESCCKALDEMKEPVTEAPRKVEMVKVFGMKIAKQAWENFWNDHSLSMVHAPNYTGAGGYVADPQAGIDPKRPTMGKLEQLAFKIGQIAKVTQDDGLSNLFSRVADELPDATDPKTKQILHTIAIRALRSVNKEQTAPWFESRIENNTVVAGHLAWLNSFDPDRVLTEVAWHPMDPSFDADPYDNAGDDAIASFDPHEFVDSEQAQDMLSGREPDGEENHLTKDEIMGALEGYLRHYIDMHSPDQIGGFDDVNNLAEMVYPQAVDALQEAGYVVKEEELVEADMMEDEELTIEDVLLPKDNQGDDFATDVTTADITDPDDSHKHGPVDATYTSRLMTLAGMNVGSGGQSGPGY